MDVRSLPIDLRSLRPLPRGALIALALLVATATVLSAAAFMSYRKVQSLRLMHSRLVHEASVPAPMPEPRARPIAPYDASARIALVQSQAGWAPLLASLETMQVQGITPIEFDVSASDRKVRVTLEFADLAGLIKYLDDINAGEEIPRWQLIQAQGSRQVATAAVAGTVPLATIEGKW